MIGLVYTWSIIEVDAYGISEIDIILLRRTRMY
jgi:hypothetical protein